MNTSATHHAIGALKLVDLHLDHPHTVPASVLRGAAHEAIGHLQNNQPHADDLVRLYTLLLNAVPNGHLPHVTLRDDATRPFGCVITNAQGNMVDQQIGKTIEGLSQIISSRWQGAQ